jgi:hypothetical protein
MGKIKAAFLDAETQPETVLLAMHDYQISEIAERLEQMINSLAVANGDQLSFLIDDLRTEILYFNDVIRRH